MPRKRALLATHAVSTVDQLEMGGMRVKHGFVRLMGLANKPIVVDEAHAYDEYMSAIIRRTLRWLGEMQVPVVILSATLPSRVRARLVAAYTGRPCPEPAGCLSVDHAGEAWRADRNHLPCALGPVARGEPGTPGSR